MRIKSYKNYRAVIIGAGRIAAGFDTPRSREVFTHAHAYAQHPKVTFAGFYDIDVAAANRAAKKWGTEAYANFDVMMREVAPHIVSVCTPDETHYHVLKRIAAYSPMVVVCEKPLTLTMAEGKKIITLYKKKRIALVVNYSRRFDETMQLLRDGILQKKYGSVQFANALYTKGVLHNGSHIIDLAHFLFGKVRTIQVLDAITDYSSKDKTVSGYVTFERCPQFFLQGADDRKYPIIELDILFEKARFRYYDFGFKAELQAVGHDPKFKGFRALQEPKPVKTQLIQALPNLIENVVKFLDKKEKLISNVDDALQTQQTCTRLLKNYYGTVSN